ncbi:MAG: hypothetical protein DRR42_07810 [Gammaproteobacteria bacterium]|nr:MAG: hypothetical protein DRR42_07810 [Gammaproteobacteria bacterium]
MIVKTHISKTLSALDKRYTNSDSEGSIFFAKLAVLEYCGWIEESLDDVVHRAVKGKLKTQEFSDMLNSLIKVILVLTIRGISDPCYPVWLDCKLQKN